MLKTLLYLIGLPFLFIGEVLTKKHTSPKKSYIYGIRTYNSKSYIYVGKADNVEVRLRQHISLCFDGKHYNKGLQKVIRGAKFCVTYDILEVCNSKNVYKREAFHINKHKSKRLKNERIPLFTDS